MRFTWNTSNFFSGDTTGDSNSDFQTAWNINNSYSLTMADGNSRADGVSDFEGSPNFVNMGSERFIPYLYYNDFGRDLEQDLIDLPGNAVQVVPSIAYDLGAIATIPIPLLSAQITGLGIYKTHLDMKEGKISKKMGYGSMGLSAVSFIPLTKPLAYTWNISGPLLYDTITTVQK